MVSSIFYKQAAPFWSLFQNPTLNYLLDSLEKGEFNAGESISTIILFLTMWLNDLKTTPYSKLPTNKKRDCRENGIIIT